MLPMISVRLAELVIVTKICFNLYFSAGLSTVVVSDQCVSRGTGYSHFNLLQSIFLSLLVNRCCL